MKMNPFLFAILTITAIAFASAAQADEKLDALKAKVVANYAAMAGQSTADAHAQAVELKKAVAAFTAAPSIETRASGDGCTR